MTKADSAPRAHEGGGGTPRRDALRAALAFGLTGAIALRSASARAADSVDDTLIVAAESAYGDIARQIAGPQAEIVSLLRDPHADPAHFRPDPKTASLLARADIVIANGGGYDDWLAPLMQGSAAPGRSLLLVSRLPGLMPGTTGPFWYDPGMAPALARAIVADLAADDPDSAKALGNREALFLRSLQPAMRAMAALRARAAAAPVMLAMPAAAPLIRALGLLIVPPDVAALQAGKVRALVYDRRAPDAALLAAAKAAGVKLCGLWETRPVGVTYQDWMAASLHALDEALPQPSP